MAESFAFGRVRRLTEELGQHIVRKRFFADQEELNDQGNISNLTNGEYIGRKDGSYTITGAFDVSSFFKRGKKFIFEVSSRYYNEDNTKNPQLKLYIRGQLVQSFDINHHYCPVEESWIDNEGKITFQLDLYSGNEERKFPINISILDVDWESFRTYFDFKNALACWQAQPENSDNANEYEAIVTAAANELCFLDVYSSGYYQSLRKSSQQLEKLIRNNPNAPEVFAVGHTHIDMAWLWTLQQTIEKGERSFSSILNLMKSYPELYFMHTSPQLYQFIKERNPELYDRIKNAVKEKRWQPEGSMWIEADCNLTSGESLVRQILYGKRFFKQEFGIEDKVLWLPDVFGYSAALPQILKKSNIDYFMSTKLSWNDTNGIPYDSFFWQGIDGSKVLTHLINTISEDYNPTPWFTTYNGLLNPNVVKKSWDSYKQKKISNEILIAYGYGDGGGGPTFEMLETIKRLQHGYLGMPRVVPAFATAFFDKLNKDTAKNNFPVWMGELYFENHRGTYTSIARAKRENRLIENLLQTVEKLYTLYDFNNYPQAELKEIWERTLLNQFHDILPGSAIEPVYEQLFKDNQSTFTSLTKLLSQLKQDIIKYRKNNVLVYNQLSFKRKTIIKTKLNDNEGLFDIDGHELISQNSYDGSRLVEVAPSSLSFANYAVKNTSRTINKVIKRNIGSDYETQDFKIQFDKDYNICSLYDKKTNREIVVAGKKFNQLVVYEDYPAAYDAWNIDKNYEEKYWLVNSVLSATVIEQGEIRDTLKIVRKFHNSKITQYIHIYHGTRQINYETKVDWHEHHCLLRVLFPVAINANYATYDIQFGNIDRSVSNNTSWQQAQFEVSGQKWMDLSEGNYGISLLSDSKYGYNAEYQQLGISLIKSATEPDPVADQGEHSFTYATVVHDDTWQKSLIMNKALDLNNHCLVWKDSTLSLRNGKGFSLDVDNVLIDSIKKAEDSQEIIIRMYEFENKDTNVELTTPLASTRVINCDLLENNLEPLISEKNKIKLHFSPFEIKTIKVTLDYKQ